MLKFDKDATIEAIKNAGNGNKITDVIIEDLNNFDGCIATKSNWDALVNDMELYIVKGKDGRTIKVERNLLKEWGDA